MHSFDLNISIHLWDKDTGVQLLDHVVIRCLVLQKPAKVAYRTAIPLYIPTSNV